MTDVTLHHDPAGYLANRIAEFVRESPRNRLWRIDDTPIWGEPLVGFADGDDALFQEYKRIIGAYHYTPRELIAFAANAFADAPHRSTEQVSVISWILPAAEQTRESNRQERAEPSRRWTHTRQYGEDFNDAVRYLVVDLLLQAGFLAITMSTTSPIFKRYDVGVPNVPSSNWSERHIAYAAGLGTFGLSDGFISPLGMAIRCGSVVTNMPIPASSKPYKNHVSNCLYLDEGTCGECITRCPAGAISAAGHDKQKCLEYTGETLSYIKMRHGLYITGCGLCQTAVPCEAEIPKRRRG
jgi:epoxyqueuosine reductase